MRLTRLMSLFNVGQVERVHVLIQRLLDEILRLVAGQLQHSAAKTNITYTFI